MSRPGTTPLVTAALGNHLPWLACTDTYCILHPASPIPRPLHPFLSLFFSFHLPLRKTSGKSSCVSQLKTSIAQVRILLRELGEGTPFTPRCLRFLVFFALPSSLSIKAADDSVSSRE